MPPVETQLSDKPINPKIGIIYPPPEVRNIVDKTASFVARNGPDFESRIRQNEINNPKFNFLNPTDPYHAYYQHKVRDFSEGKAVESASLKVTAPSAARLGQDTQKLIQDVFVPKDPPAEFEFVHDPASINALDIDIVKLTAQFVARNGKQFLAQLMNREQRNYQFDFLRTQHNMFGYFTKLVEQYTKVLIPPRNIIDTLDNDYKNPKSVLDIVKYRVDWKKYQERQRQREEEAVERERVAYAMIDWHDFVVVETVDFQPNATGSFPMPTTPEEVGARAIAEERGDTLLEQKKPITNVPPPPGSFDAVPTDLDEFADDDDDDDDDYVNEEEEEAMESREAAEQEVEPPPLNVEEQVPENTDDQPAAEPEPTVLVEDKEPEVEAEPEPELPTTEDDMELSDEEADIPQSKPEVKQHPPYRRLPPSADQVLIRHDYDPKVQQHKEEHQFQLVSPFTGEKIPASQAQKHIHVGLLDPKWIEQRDREIREKREQDQVYASGSLIDSSLKQLAKRRTDIFGIGSEETQIGKTLGEEETPQKPEKLIWDGHAMSAESVNKRTRDYITPADVQAHFEAEQKLEAEREKIGVQVSLTSSKPPTLGTVIMPPPQTLGVAPMVHAPPPPPNLLMMMGNAPPGMMMPPAPLPPSMFPPGMLLPGHQFMPNLGSMTVPPNQVSGLPAPPAPPPLTSTLPAVVSGVPPPLLNASADDEPEAKRSRAEVD